jgi:hypothetical protein
MIDAAHQAAWSDGFWAITGGAIFKKNDQGNDPGGHRTGRRSDTLMIICAS